jgi:hypothetical protein
VVIAAAGSVGVAVEFETAVRGSVAVAFGVSGAVVPALAAAVAGAGPEPVARLLSGVAGVSSNRPRKNVLTSPTVDTTAALADQIDGSKSVMSEYVPPSTM